MLSDKDIKSWDQRLKDQARRGWDNYVHLRIDLSEARTDQPLQMTGEYIYVEDSSDDDLAVAKIKLNRNTNDALDLEKGVKIKTIFTECFITNAALADEWIDIIFGINFEYKKKIADGDGFTNPITTAPGVDLVLLPGAGGITQIGDAGATSRGFINNDDLFVSGKLEVDGISYFEGQVNIFSTLNCNSQIVSRSYFWIYGNVGNLKSHYLTEEITIPVGQGAAGVVSLTNLVPDRCFVIGVVCKVTQAPGGGATIFDVGRTAGGNLDEFVDGDGPGGAVGVALGTMAYFTRNRDAATLSTILNRAADTVTITTDVNVAVSDMKIRVDVFFRQENQG